MNSSENYESLLQLGFTQAEIEQLKKFRREYMERAQQISLAEQHHLEFLRWLAATGRLTE